MKKEAINNVKKPNAFIYYSIVPFLKLYYWFVYHHRVDKSAMSGVKPPYLVIAGHSCWLDYIITCVCMFPVRMNYVGAYNFFRNRVLKFLFTFMGVIPKFQFTNDITSIKRMKNCIDHGRAVALFPHGCLSNEGKPGGFAVFGIAKLVKFLNVPVVAIKTDGGYLTRPRWTKRARRGILESQVSLILTVDEITKLSNEEIYHRMMHAIDYDDYKWQRKRMITFRGKKAAEGVEFVLYKCPKCLNEYTLRSEGDRMFCQKCGNIVRMNKYLMFEPQNADTIFFDGIDKWFDFQKKCLEKEIEDPSFELAAKTELKYNEPGKFGYQHQGFGELRLSRTAIIYTGSIMGEPSKLILPMKNIPMIPFSAGEYIEVAEGDKIHRFILDERRQMIKWVMAVRQIRDKFYEEAR
ncbi:MAG: lysophospholipid acyltransferase family protein [Saccharofermentanales bacterium]